MRDFCVRLSWRFALHFPPSWSLALITMRRFLYILLLVFVARISYSDVTLYKCILRSARPDHTVFDVKYATSEQGASGGLAGDRLLFPQLTDMKSASFEGGHVYWDNSFTRDTAPYLYTVVRASSVAQGNIKVPTAHTNEIPNIMQMYYEGFPTAPERASLASLTVSYDNDGNASLNASTYYTGYIIGNGVVVHDETGKLVLALPDDSGFVPGYYSDPLSDGVPRQVWYDPNHQDTNSPGYAIRLDSLVGNASASLTYDADTGLYSYSQPDYSSVLSSINQGVSDLNRKEIVIDNIRLELPDDFEINVPAPEVTVNPQVTVNPTVTVTPDVTVNVTAPTQNDITVAIDNSDVISSIETLAGQISDYTDETAAYTAPLANEYRNVTVNDFDTTSMSLDNEEQGLVDVVQGWQTQIPVISNACDIALGAAFGNIPTIPPSDLVPLHGFSIFGFNFIIDFTPFANHFLWFRAFCLMLEVVWFLNSIWKMAVQAMQV